LLQDRRDQRTNKITLLAFDRWSINDLKRELDPIGCVQLVREKVSDIPIGLVSADLLRYLK
jgi:hypothetical protein